MSVLDVLKPKTEFQTNCMKLLRKRLDGRISEEEFDKENAYLVLEEECFKEIYPKMEPLPPTEIVEYRMWAKEKKDKLSREFWEQAHIKNYLEVAHDARVHNMSKMSWLVEIQKHIPEGDIVAHSKIRERIKLFKQEMQ